MANITAYGSGVQNPALVPYSEPFEDMLSGFMAWPVTYGGHKSPLLRVDVTESDDAYHVLCDMPGMKKDDIAVTIEGSDVTIAGEVKQEQQAGAQERLLWSERATGRVERTLSFSRDIDQSRVDARYVDGVLELTLPKTEMAARKRITIH
ncbi:MAG: Hsp20/alpha crystallin family protein [Rhodospirillaceae bacterium]